MRVGVGEAGRERVDEDVAVVALVELDLAAHRRHAEASCRSRRRPRPRPKRGAGSFHAPDRRSAAHSSPRPAARPW